MQSCGDERTLVPCPSPARALPLADRALRSAEYELLRHTPAEIGAGALLAAWSVVGHTDATVHHLAPLANGCGTAEAHLVVCTNELLRYFQVHGSPIAAQPPSPPSDCPITPFRVLAHLWHAAPKTPHNSDLAVVGGPHWTHRSRALQVCFPDATGPQHELFLPIAGRKEVRAVSPDCVHTLALS
jgi:hypothetical protein